MLGKIFIGLAKRSQTNLSETWFLLTGGFIIILSRWLTRSYTLYHWDSVQFALAIEQKLDITHHQPHPPGYILYVYLGKLVNLVTHDANLAMVLISVIFSVLTFFVLYQLAKEVFSTKVAYVSALLMIADRLLWFHGSIALNYTVEAFLVSLIALLGWRFVKEKDFLDLALMTIVLGIAGGFRLSVTAFMLPLWIWVASQGGIWTFIKSTILLGLSTLVWFVPTAVNIGGINQTVLLFTETSKSVLLNFPAQFSSLQSGVWSTFLNNGLRMIYLLGMSLGVGLILLLFMATSPFFLGWPKGQLIWNKFWLLLLWIAPALGFYLFIFFYNAGYLMIFYPALLILVALSLVFVTEQLGELLDKSSDMLLGWGLALLVTVSASTFILSASDKQVVNDDLSIGQIRKVDTELQSFVSAIRRNFNPDDTIIYKVGDSFQLGYRHLAYYLPEYKVCAPLALPLYNWNQGQVRVRCSSFGKETYLDKVFIDKLDKRLLFLRTDETFEAGSAKMTADSGFALPWYDLDSEEGKQLIKAYEQYFYMGDSV